MCVVPYIDTDDLAAIIYDATEVVVIELQNSRVSSKGHFAQCTFLIHTHIFTIHLNLRNKREIFHQKGVRRLVEKLVR